MGLCRFVGKLETPHGVLDLSGRSLVMGILNVTPDSFSDGGLFVDADAAVRRACEMLAEGADLIDVGGESTRPGADPVPADEQIRRVVPVIRRIRQERPDAIVSIDARCAEVAAAALDAGADMINDVSAMQHDSEMLPLAAERAVPVVLMHMKGTPKTMLQEAVYDDVVTEVIDFLKDRVRAAVEAGLQRERIIVDPGIGFAKQTHHNLEILRRLDEFHSLGLPLLVGPSRKRFIGHVLGIENPRERLFGTLAAVAACCLAGVHIVRVHDVGPARQVAELCDAICNPRRYG